MSERPTLAQRAYRSFRRRIGFPAERCNENRALLEAVGRVRPDIVFVEKGLTLWPQTLRAMRAGRPRVILVSYSQDDMMNPGNQSRYYVRGLAVYDVHFTTKVYNVAELRRLGAQRVEMTGNGFSPHVHRPIALSDQEVEAFGAEVSFVGGYESDRAGTLNILAENDIHVRVWGNNWGKFRNAHPLLRLERRPAYGDDYARVVCGSKILLGFLRKVNRDVETTRTVEIPAFGAFLLAERTEAQRALFEEGVEAEYFDDTGELIRKISHYLTNNLGRAAIGRAGRERCLRAGYSYDDRMAEILRICREIQTEREGSLNRCG
jgi:spore maturation protein CgeB